MATKSEAQAENPSAFKHLVNEASAKRLASEIKRVYPAFDAVGLVRDAKRELPALELKPRIRFLSDALAKRLPTRYPEALQIVLATLGPTLEDGDAVSSSAFYYWVHATFVEQHGLAHFDESLNAMREITQRSTAEFAIRPYLQRDLPRALAFLRACTDDPSQHVRRWVSEGTRPYLPWGMRVPELVREPKHGLALLEALKGDPSAYVRTSIANHLNDVSKTHADHAVGTVHTWLKHGVHEAEWVAKRALRGLIKAGHPAALAVFGVDTHTAATVARFKLHDKEIRVGDHLTFEVTLVGGKAEPLVIDYALGFPGANGRTSRKVFKWATREIAEGERITLQKRHSFRPITTRVYRAGKHTLELLVNGNALKRVSFELRLR